MTKPHSGIINVLKHPGITSHGVVLRMRRILQMRQIGHGGTLDPGATGVLPLMFGRATKLMPYVVEHEKTYRAEMTLGVSTDTQDASGIPVSKNESFLLPWPHLIETVSRFIGHIKQVPPMTSAVRRGGERLYERARRGEEVDRQPRTVQIKRIDVLKSWSPHGDEKLVYGTRLLLDIECSKGTYIRTLCHDIGQALGCGAHMSYLVRTRVGPFQLHASHTLDEIEQALEDNAFENMVLPLYAGIPQLPRIDVDDVATQKLRQGQSVVVDFPSATQERPEHENVAVVGPQDILVCIARVCQDVREMKIRPTRVF